MHAFYPQAPLGDGCAPPETKHASLRSRTFAFALSGTYVIISRYSYAFPVPYSLRRRVRFLNVFCRYFKQDSAAEITARDTLIKGYNKLKLDTTAGVPLDDEEDPEAAAAGEMTLDKVRAAGLARRPRVVRLLSLQLLAASRHTVSRRELSLHQTS